MTQEKTTETKETSNLVKAMLSFKVVDESGKLDVQRMTQEFAKVAEEWQNSHSTIESGVAEKVLELFNQNKDNKPIRMSVLKTKVCSTLMDDDGNNLGEVTSSFETYMKSNTGKLRSDGKLFSVKIGIGGGVRLWSQIPVEEDSKQ